MNKYFKKLQYKCNMNEKLIHLITNYIDKLIDLGYVKSTHKNSLYKKLFNNIDSIIISHPQAIEFKSGSYDPLKKEIYIKDINNIESVYLRLTYALTTNIVSENEYNVGYSKTILNLNNYKIEHINYGLNRAICSNIVSKIFNNECSSYILTPEYRNFEKNFLNMKITSENNLYFVEGILLKQLLHSFEIDEHELYYNLFNNNPQKKLNKIFKNYDIQRLFNIIDKISITYSKYNKLCYFNLLLTNNYNNIKKYCIEDNINLELYKSEEKKLKNILKSLISKNCSLDETLEDLENTLMKNIDIYQSILLNTLILQRNKYEPISYARHLKFLESISISKSLSIKKHLLDFISKEIIKIEDQNKIKSIIMYYLLSYDKYIKIYDQISFNILPNKTKTSITILIYHPDFCDMITISNMDKNVKIKDYELTSLKYLMEINYVIKDIEKIYSEVKEKEHNNNLSSNNMYISKNKEHIYILVKNGINLSVYDYKTLEKIDEGIDYLLIKKDNLPSIYKNNIFKLFNKLFKI